jgi:hypothetical protein
MHKTEEETQKSGKETQKTGEETQKRAGNCRKAEIKVPRNTDGERRAGRKVSTWEKTQSVNPQLRIPRARCAVVQRML